MQNGTGEGELDQLRRMVRRTEIKVRGVHPEDKDTILFTIFAQVNAYVIFFLLKCVNLYEEIDLSLSNDKDAIRLKKIRF